MNMLSIILIIILALAAFIVLSMIAKKEYPEIKGWKRYWVTFLLFLIFLIPAAIVVWMYYTSGDIAAPWMYGPRSY